MAGKARGALESSELSRCSRLAPRLPKAPWEGAATGRGGRHLVSERGCDDCAALGRDKARMPSMGAFEFNV